MNQPGPYLIDLHIHLLPGVDDGPRTLEDTISLLKVAHANNVRTLVATPHMFLEPYNLRVPDVVRGHFARMQEALRKASQQEGQEFLADMTIWAGAENYACPDFLQALDQNQVLTLGESRYLLVEFPLFFSVDQIRSVVDAIQAHNLVPILAHVERYLAFKRSPEKLEGFLEQGCLTQMNLGSLFESRWSVQGRLIRQFIKRDLISIIASDSHGSQFRPPVFSELKKRPAGLGEEQFSRLCAQNPNWVLRQSA